VSTGLSLAAQVRHDLTEGGVLSHSLPGYEERAAQIEMADLVAQALESGQHAVVEAGTGTGKALDVDTPIPTPTGWNRMGDLVVGDLVFDETGQPTRVVAAFDTMYERPCYEVVFSDGATLVADAEHQWASCTCADRKSADRPLSAIYTSKKFVTPDKLLMLDQLIAVSQETDTLSIHRASLLLKGHHWSVFQAAKTIPPANPGARYAYYPRRTLLSAVRVRLAKDLREHRRDGRKYTVVTTEQMAATLTIGASKRANHAIAVAGAFSLPDRDLPIHPYFLGVWLGDGSTHRNQITTADLELVLEIEKLGYIARKVKGNYRYTIDDENGKSVSRWQPGMTGRLRALGLRLNKHIPAIYLRASEKQRRALLAGLLDTDGTVNHAGAVEFTTTNFRLAEDFYELACSLGFRPWRREGRARLNGKDCGPKWMVAFTTDQRVFQLPRKAAAHKERLRNYTPERNNFRYVEAVRQVSTRPVRCIQVESASHLYLAGRAMIPTHNSLAYLVPIVRSDKVAIISTANKNLQEQLFYKDIPFVQAHVRDFRAALIKGMGNYLCLERFDRENRELLPIMRTKTFDRLLKILQGDADGELDGAEFDGDLDLLPFPVNGDQRARIAADSDQCAWSKCNFFLECYVREMRQKARDSQIIVVNHTLLLLDAALEGWLLPERDVVVIDEAHHLEEEATRAFTTTVSPGRVQSLLQQRRLRDHVDRGQYEEAGQRNITTWDRLGQMSERGSKNRTLLTQPFQEGLHLATAIDRLAESLKYHRPENLDDKEDQLYDKLIKRARTLASDLRTAFGVEDLKSRVYYVERTAEMRGGQAAGLRQLSVSAAPLSVTELLRQGIFDKINTISTSATIAVGGDFGFFRRRVGAIHNVVERVLPPAFDYPNHALLYLPRGLPEPAYGDASERYLEALAREIVQLVQASRGRAFLLFSSQRAMLTVYEHIRDQVDYPLLLQGDFSRVELIKRFRTIPNAVLLGLKSFWEGVDIAGETLSLVVIDKLPFDPPDDPVHEARVRLMKEANEDWFNGYVLPQATLRLKQGIGRLIRTKEDRGVMAILDSRLHTKYYGSRVVAALPPARRTSDIADVRKFFEEA
jgi:Rad3-related DNA helicase